MIRLSSNGQNKDHHQRESLAHRLYDVYWAWSFGTKALFMGVHSFAWCTGGAVISKLVSFMVFEIIEDANP